MSDKRYYNFDDDDDGVIYTPGSAVNPDFEPGAGDNKNFSFQPEPPKKKKKYKSHFKTLMMITIISGVLICMVVFSVVYNSFSDGSNKVAVETTTEDPFQTEASSENANTELKSGDEIVGIIKNINPTIKELTLYSIYENKNYVLKANASTEMKSKYDDVMSIQEFEKGEIVLFSFDEDKRLTKLRVNPDAWEYKSVTGVKVNTENKTISKNNDTYIYNDLTTVTYKGEETEIKDIMEIDTVTFKGYKTNVYTIDVEKGHADLKVTNYAAIQNGAIEIDTNVYKSLSEADNIKISEGTHKVVVKGTNIEPYSKEITVTAGVPFTVDLANVQMKSGVLLIRSNVTDYILTINGVPELSREPLILPYGPYTITVQKEGYLGYETQIVVDRAQMNIYAELKKETLNGKLTVTSNPVGADVYIDGTLSGVTPLTTEVEQGQHSLMIKKAGYKTITLNSVNVEKQGTYNIELQEEITTTATTTVTAG